MNFPKFTLFSSVPVWLGLLGCGAALAQPAFKMEVGLGDDGDGNQSVAFSSLSNFLPVGFYYEGKEVGAVLPLTLSGNSLHNFLSALTVEIFLVNPINSLEFTFRLYDVGIDGVPTGAPLYTANWTDPDPFTPGAYEIFVEQIATFDGEFDLTGKSQVAFTVDFTGLTPGQGGLSMSALVGDAIEREFVLGGDPDGEFFTIAVVIPETGSLASGALLALACGGLYLKRRKA